MTGFVADTLCGKITIGTLGVVIAICASISALYKHQENWMTYRTTCESLKHEKYRFTSLTKTREDVHEFQAFVERIEALISKENTQWSRYMSDKTNNKNTQK